MINHRMIEWIPENYKKITRVDKKMHIKGALSFSVLLRLAPQQFVVLRGARDLL